jgi:hypothetical protein
MATKQALLAQNKALLEDIFNLAKELGKLPDSVDAQND